jgi:hypothetical protein
MPHDIRSSEKTIWQITPGTRLKRPTRIQLVLLVEVDCMRIGEDLSTCLVNWISVIPPETR